MSVRPRTRFCTALAPRRGPGLVTRSADRSSRCPTPPAPGTAFWETLGDTTLGRLVGEALRANHDIRAAAARVREARASGRRPRSISSPTVTVAAGYTRQRIAGATFPRARQLPGPGHLGRGGEASGRVDVFGRIRRNVQGQRRPASSSAQQDYRYVEVRSPPELASAYFDLRGAQGQLAVARRNAENQRRTLEVTQQRLDAGRGTAFDTERARAQLSSTLAAIPALESRIASAQYRVGVLVGRPPSAVAPELEAAVALPPLPESVAWSSPDSLARRRPDVRGAERRLAAETAFTRSARAEYLPRLSVERRRRLHLRRLRQLRRQRHVALRGRPGHLVAGAQSRPGEGASRRRASAAGRGARPGTSRAYSARCRRPRPRWCPIGRPGAGSSGSTSAAAASERAAELARLRFEGGVADFLQVLDAQRTVLDAQDRLALGRTDATTALVEVYRAIGGDWRQIDGGHCSTLAIGAMDNLTHTLAGAVLAKAGLDRRTPLAMPTLLVAANLPDLDVLAYLRDPLFALTFRRGWTHGVLAMAVLPLALASSMAAWDRLVRRRRRPDAAPAPFRELLLLSFAGVLSHPLLDLLNTYGVRLLMPFSGRWFYGDTLFIVDPWLWGLLGLAWPWRS